MKRRTVLRRMTAAGIATMGLAGTASATRPEVELDRELDVASVSGTVTLDTLLEEQDLERLSSDVDPAERTFIIDESVESIRIQDCCTYCCDGEDLVCECGCCECELC